MNELFTLLNEFYLHTFNQYKNFPFIHHYIDLQKKKCKPLTYHICKIIIKRNINKQPKKKNE